MEVFGGDDDDVFVGPKKTARCLATMAALRDSCAATGDAVLGADGAPNTGDVVTGDARLGSTLLGAARSAA